MKEMRRRGDTRRTNILSFIREYQAKHGYAPSIDEMASETGTTKSNVHYHLLALRESGLLSSTPGVARSWVVKG